MPRSVTDKLSAVISEIDARGNADLLRLTVLKKWFERPGRLASFALWIAGRAASRGGEGTQPATDLIGDARALLRDGEFWATLDRSAAERLHGRLRDHQNTYKRLKWGPVRIVTDRNLFLIEEALALYLWSADAPSLGYKLAVAYCEHYDSRYGNGLNGPSRDRVEELIDFVRRREASEGKGSASAARDG